MIKKSKSELKIEMSILGMKSKIFEECVLRTNFLFENF
jgi:hypothetical protein